jgi:hypothetical protein
VLLLSLKNTKHSNIKIKNSSSFSFLLEVKDQMIITPSMKFDKNFFGENTQSKKEHVFCVVVEYLQEVYEQER